MQIASYITQITGLSLMDWGNLAVPRVTLKQDASGPVYISYWDTTLSAKKPSQDDLAKALTLPEPVE